MDDLGFGVGHSFGLYEAYVEARNAYEAGEIELWLEYNRPKSGEEWDTWTAEHGSHEEFTKRWKKED